MDKVHLYRDDSDSGEYRWRRVSENGLEVSASSEGYDHHSDALQNILDTQGGQEFEIVDETE